MTTPEVANDVFPLLMMDQHQMGGYHRAVALCSKELYPPPGFGAQEFDTDPHTNKAAAA